jgi:hypothetical protein
MSDEINLQSHRKSTHPDAVGLLPNMRGGKAGMQDLCYNYILHCGPTNSADLYLYLSKVQKEYKRKTIKPNSILQLSQVLMRSLIFSKIGKEKQLSPSAGQRMNIEYPLWDRQNVDEVAKKILSVEHRRSVKRMPSILKKAIKDMEVTA